MSAVQVAPDADVTSLPYQVVQFEQAVALSASSSSSLPAQAGLFSEPQVIKIGMRVMPHSLRAAKRNGALGAVISVGERVGVILDCTAGSPPKSFKSENVFLVDCGPPPPSGDTGLCISPFASPPMSASCGVFELLDMKKGT